MLVMAAVLLLGSLAVTASAQGPSAKGLNFYSIERERELGWGAAANLERAAHLPRAKAGCLHCATQRRAGEVRELSVHLHLRGV